MEETDTKTQKLTVGNIEIEISAPYRTGKILDENEAKKLTQIRDQALKKELLSAIKK